VRWLRARVYCEGMSVGLAKLMRSLTAFFIVARRSRRGGVPAWHGQVEGGKGWGSWCGEMACGLARNEKRVDPAHEEI
jgi:hypothetical protein